MDSDELQAGRDVLMDDLTIQRAYFVCRASGPKPHKTSERRTHNAGGVGREEKFLRFRLRGCEEL
jgi:hypothetical protein